MEAKGTAVLTVGKFVRARFGEESHSKWLKGLSPAAHTIHGRAIMPSLWYPTGPGLVEPTQHACDLFYGGDLRGAWECGRFSAEEGLKGVYRALLTVGPTAFIIKKASNVLPLYYRPAEIALVAQTSKSITLHMTLFDEPHVVLDHRIGGWMEGFLETSGSRGVEVKIPRSMAKGDPLTEFVIQWS